MTRICDLEQWLAERGLSTPSEPGLHSPAAHVSTRARRAALKDLERQLRDHSRRVAAACAEYTAAVERGDVRPLTRKERLERAARGHPDLPSTQAARRLLERMK